MITVNSFWGSVILGLLILVVIALPVAAIIHILRNRIGETPKILWILMVLLFPILGPILYFLFWRNIHASQVNS
jgi:hypothetical protein